MKWIKLEIGKLPEEEILVANFEEGSYGYKEKNLGFVYDDNGIICCDGAELLENCTHYIDIHKHDIE